MYKIILMIILVGATFAVIIRKQNSKLKSIKYGCWESCRFPFYDNGIQYDTCKLTESDTYWCRVQEGYKGWSIHDKVNCPKECKCNFPFLHNGILHGYCIYENSTRPWCSTVYGLDYHPEDWTYCEEKCDPDPCSNDEVCANLGDTHKCLKMKALFKDKQ